MLIIKEAIIIDYKKILALRIKPLCEPELIYLTPGYQGFFDITDGINIGTDGKTFNKSYNFDVTQLTDKLHLFCNENAEMLEQPLNRKIGNISFYGTIYLANLDEFDELITMTNIEAYHFCYIFKDRQISINNFKI